MTDPLKDHFVRTTPRGNELPERGVYLGDVFALVTADGTEIIHEWNGQRWVAHAEPPLVIEATPDFHALLAALVHQIELGDYTDQNGHKPVNNVHFIAAKEALGK